MAAKLGVSTEEFYSKYARQRGRGESKRWELNEVRNGRGYDCVFLDRSSMPGKAVCKLYEQRPRQCKTWPFWPDNLESPQAWKSLKLGPEGCPGVDKGDPVPFETIVSLRDSAGLQ